MAWARTALTALLLGSLDAASSTEGGLTPDGVQQFLTGLDGSWQGRAVVTPVGPRPYDIVFESAGECVAGHADPGAALHYWTFCPVADGLRLRFLSTFRGNQQPRLLDATRALGGTVVFSAPDPDELQVHVDRQADRITVRIVRRQRLHVRIEWSRPPNSA